MFSPDGTGGLCYEHSPAEGIVLVQIIEKALDAVSKKRGPDGAAEEPAEPSEQRADDAFPAPKRLAWKVDDETRRAVQEAAADVDR